MYKKIGYSALSLFFFVIFAIAIMLITNIFFNKESTFFQRNKDSVQTIVTQLEGR